MKKGGSMQLQREFDMAGVGATDAKPQPTGRYRAYMEMLGELKKERNKHA